MNKTVFGKNVYAVGGNPEAAAVSGINITRRSSACSVSVDSSSPSQVSWKPPAREVRPTTMETGRARCHRVLRRRWSFHHRWCGNGQWCHCRCHHLQFHQLRPYVHRGESLLAEHHQGCDHRIGGIVRYPQVRPEEVVSSLFHACEAGAILPLFASGKYQQYWIS